MNTKIRIGVVGCRNFNNYDKYKKPLIDQIIPKAKGGTNDLNNLQFLTWFENLSKRDMTQEEWEVVKSNIGGYFV
jgi:hypothetical protein